MSIHCIHCGTELPDIAQFCSTCGKPPKGEATVNGAPTVNDSPFETYPAYAQAPTIKADSPSGPDPLIPPPPPLSSYYSTESLYAPSSASAPSRPLLAKRKSRRRLWIGLAIIAVVLMAAGGGFVYYFVNQSTPTKTLQAACDDEKSQDYQGLYNLFTLDFQRQIASEGQFAANEKSGNDSRGGIVSCTINAVNENGSSASGTIVWTYGNGSTSTVTYQLADENGTWKISGV